LFNLLKKIDLSILNQLEQYGFQYDNAQKCLDGNQHNPVTTTYEVISILNIISKDIIYC